MINLLAVLKRFKAKKEFKKNALVGDRFCCGFKSRCLNDGSIEQINIGSNVEIHGTLIVNGNGNIKIGNNVTIRHNTLVASCSKIEIGNEVIISNNVTIMDNNSHPTDPSIRKKMSIEGPHSEFWKAIYAETTPILIEDNVWICERAVILKGIKIGKGSIVACDSVVTKVVPENCIVAGNPAKIVKYLNK